MCLENSRFVVGDYSIPKYHRLIFGNYLLNLVRFIRDKFTIQYMGMILIISST